MRNFWRLASLAVLAAGMTALADGPAMAAGPVSGQAAVARAGAESGATEVTYYRYGYRHYRHRPYYGWYRPWYRPYVYAPPPVVYRPAPYYYYPYPYYYAPTYYYAVP